VPNNTDQYLSCRERVEDIAGTRNYPNYTKRSGRSVDDAASARVHHERAERERERDGENRRENEQPDGSARPEEGS